MSDHSFEIWTTVDLSIDGNFLTEFDALAQVTTDLEGNWQITDWKYEAEDGSRRSLYSQNGSHPLKVALWAACKAHESEEGFRQRVDEEVIDYVGPLPSLDDEHRLPQSAFL